MREMREGEGVGGAGLLPESSKTGPLVVASDVVTTVVDTAGLKGGSLLS